MSENFDEPWIMDEYYVLDKTGAYIGLIGEMGGKDCSRRIVACVNACASCSDEDLADDCVNKMRKDRDMLLSQRDELLAALTHAATDYIDQNGSVPSWWTDKIRQMVKDFSK